MSSRNKEVIGERSSYRRRRRRRLEKRLKICVLPYASVSLADNLTRCNENAVTQSVCFFIFVSRNNVALSLHPRPALRFEETQ